MNPSSTDAALVATATTPIVKPLASMVLPVLVFFVFFYVINFAAILGFKKVFKVKISWPLMVATVGAAAAATFLVMLLSFMVTDKTIFTFPLTFAMMVSSIFLLSKFLLKLNNKESIILGVGLSVISNPILWLVILT